MGKEAKIKIENNVRRLRFEHDEMTQAQLADKAKVTRQTIAAIEKNKYSPSLELAFMIADIFDEPLEDVFYLPKRRAVENGGMK